MTEFERNIIGGGFCSIFSSIGCIGDSLSSGELEYTKDNGEKGYWDFFEYSWGQFLSKATGCKVYNFSRGGLTAKTFHVYADENNVFTKENACQAYIIALGVNDILNHPQNATGTIDDIDFENPENSKDNFAGEYAKIIQKIKLLEPEAKIFVMTFPDETGRSDEKVRVAKEHASFLYKLSEVFDNTYVLDLSKYAPVYDEEYRKKYFLGGHMNVMGYYLTAQYVMNGIDCIIRDNTEDFVKSGLIGTGFNNNN